jgi:hypothetical protein
MPLARYFVFVGGVLLALLFISDAFLPKLPVVAGAETVVDKSIIRIRSDRKWPERIVFDTSLPTIVLPATAPAARAEAETGIQAPATVADVSAQVRARDSFAQLQPSDTKQLTPADLRKPEPKPQRKRKIAKRRAPPSMVLVAQQPQFSFFGNNTW